MRQGGFAASLPVWYWIGALLVIHCNIVFSHIKADIHKFSLRLATLYFSMVKLIRSFNFNRETKDGTNEK